jgi:hypothetical protein
MSDLTRRKPAGHGVGTDLAGFIREIWEACRGSYPGGAPEHGTTGAA